MFVRAFSLVLATVATVIAVPGGASSECDIGEAQCCDQYMTASSAPADILGLFDAGSIQGLAGLDCSPLSVVQAGGAVCQQEAVCCKDVKNDGFQIIGMNCSPISVPV